MRARALRAPVFLSSLPHQTGRCAPPPSIAASLLLIGPPKIYKIYKVLTCEEYIAVSGVFQNIDPPPPFHPASVSSPAPKAGGTQSPGSATILFFCSYLLLFFSSYLFLFFSYYILPLLTYSYLLILKLFIVLQTCV